MKFKILSIISLLFLTSCAPSNVGFSTNFSAILLQDSLINSSNEEINLTPIEFSILWYLCQNRGRVVSSEELFSNVWGEKYLEF